MEFSVFLVMQKTHPGSILTISGSTSRSTFRLILRKNAFVSKRVFSSILACFLRGAGGGGDPPLTLEFSRSWLKSHHALLP